jgi:hypothetical protein
LVTLDIVSRVSRPSQTAHLLVFDAVTPLAIPEGKAGIPFLLLHHRNGALYATDYTLHSVQNRSNKLQ